MQSGQENRAAAAPALQVYYKETPGSALDLKHKRQCMSAHCAEPLMIQEVLGKGVGALAKTICHVKLAFLWSELLRQAPLESTRPLLIG